MEENSLTKFKACARQSRLKNSTNETSATFLQERNAVLCYCMLCIACKYDGQRFQILICVFFIKSIRENAMQQAAILIKENFETLTSSGRQLKRHLRNDLM